MKKPASLFFLPNAIPSFAITVAIGLTSLSLFGEEENKNRPERESREHQDSDDRREEGKDGRGRGPENDRGPQGRPGSHPDGNFEAQINEVRKQIQHLRQEGRGEDAAAAERRLREMMERHEQARNREREHGRPPGPRPEQLEEMERRIHHLAAAAENLDQAGMNREANELRKQAENMERELETQRHRRDEGPGQGVEALHRKVAELNEIVHDLRRHIEKMEEELDDLREEIEKEEDDDDDRSRKGPQR